MIRSRISFLLRLHLFIIVLIASLSAGGSPTRIEYSLLDLRFAIDRAVARDEPPADAAVLLVTSESERRLNAVYDSSWRAWYPKIVRTLAENGTIAVIWDATFVASEPELDGALASSFAELPVYAAENDDEHNNAIVRSALAGVGWRRLEVAQDVPRRTEPVSVPSLGAIAAAATPGVAPGAYIGSLPLWIDFSYDPTAVPHFDLADIIEATDNRLADSDRTPLSVFAGRVVFIGADLPGSDRYAIPGTRGTAVAGVHVQIASMWSYLAPRRIVRADGWAARGIVALAGILVLVTGLAGMRIVRRVAVPVIVVLAIVVPPIAFMLWRIWLPAGALLGVSALAVVLVALLHRYELAHNYRTSLGFDPRLLERYHVRMDGFARAIERSATVLCADIRNYTQFVNDNPAAEVESVMTQYMAAMEELIHENGGYVNKFVGDEIIAVFGFPLSESDTSDRAVAAAGDMLVKLRELNAIWSIANLPTLDGVGIGVDCGSLRFTKIGGGRRVQFDVIGGAVNGASRLQGLTKQMGRALIASSDVAARQNVFHVSESESEGTSHSGELEFIGEVMVRGQGRRRLFGYTSPT